MSTLPQQRLTSTGLGRQRSDRHACRTFFASIGRCFVLAVFVVGLLRTAAAGEFPLDGHTFTLPEGFEIRRAAGTPLVTITYLTLDRS